MMPTLLMLLNQTPACHCVTETDNIDRVMTDYVKLGVMGNHGRGYN